LKQYNTKVNIMSITRTATALGNSEVENVLHCALPCGIVWGKGIDNVQFDKDTYYRDGKLYCAVVDVTTQDRVVHGGLCYEIVDVRNVDEKGCQMVLDLKRVQ